MDQRVHNPFPSVSSTMEKEQLQLLCGQICAETRMDSLLNPATNSTESSRPSQILVWVSGLSFVTVIGLCAVVGILVMRCLKKSIFNRFITFFVSVGVGSLSGSAVFHLLPQAFGLVDESHSHANHEYLKKSFAAVVGIYLFFFSDKIIKIVLETRKRSIKESTDQKLQGVGHTHDHVTKENGQPSQATDSLIAASHNINAKQTSVGFEENEFKRVEASDDAEQSINQQTHALCVHDHEYKEGDSVIATVAWMIIFGDGLHNFIDGITIGASFSESLLSGVSVSVAVLCEEFPHELGDVAILVNAGMTMKQALVYNLLSAISCYIGFVIGVLVGNIDETFATYTFGFAGGMFLYISLGCMMPEMKNAMEKGLNVSLYHGLEVLALQASGVITGLACMFLMARYGEAIEFA